MFIAKDLIWLDLGQWSPAKNKDPNESSIQRPFVMHHLCHIFASKRLPSKLYPPNPFKYHASHTRLLHIHSFWKDEHPPKNVHQKIPTKKTHVDQMLLTPHGSPFHSGLFQNAQQQSFRFNQLARVLSSSAQLTNPYAIPTPNNPTQPNQSNCKQLSQPNCKQPNSNSKQPNSNSNYQLPGTESQRRCCRRNPWVRHLGDPQISELNRFTNPFTKLKQFSCTYITHWTFWKMDPIHYTWLEILNISSEASHDFPSEITWIVKHLSNNCLKMRLNTNDSPIWRYLVPVILLLSEVAKVDRSCLELGHPHSSTQ